MSFNQIANKPQYFQYKVQYIQQLIQLQKIKFYNFILFLDFFKILHKVNKYTQGFDPSSILVQGDNNEEIETRTLILQICAFFLNIAISVLGSMVPYMFQNNQHVDKIISYLNIFSGGVLLSISLIHVLPETGATLNSYCGDFPLSYYILFLGVLFFTSIALLGETIGKENQSKKQDTEEIIADAEQVKPFEENKEQTVKDEQEPLLDSQSQSQLYKAVKPKEEQNKLAAAVLAIGLLTHDLFEGISLGLQTNFFDCLALFIAIFAHKICEQICQTVTGIKNGLTLKQNLAYTVPLALMTPICDIVTFLIIYFTNQGSVLPDNVYICEDIFLSFVCGNFIGLTYMEVIFEEFHCKKIKELSYKLLTFIVGFIFIAIVCIVEFFFE